ncbi:aromatic ring-hydroxylating oxygenase subunit alpha [Streptomyces spinosirectus]
MASITASDVREIEIGFDTDPARSMSLRADAYTEPKWAQADLQGIFARTWQWICHVEKLTAPGGHVSATVAGMPIAVVRDRSGTLRAFCNVCKHRAHELLKGSGTTRSIVCPCHAWLYGLDGSLRAARRADRMPTFDKSGICLDQVPVEEFGGMVYVNLDTTAGPLSEHAGDLAADIARWAPDVAGLTHAERLTYDVRSNWKNLIDNFLECYHCHIAHREFVDLVDMDTYEVKTHGIWSNHFTRAGLHGNAAYDVSGGNGQRPRRVVALAQHLPAPLPGPRQLHGVPGRPGGPDRTLATWDFFLGTPELTEAEAQSVKYIDDVLQVQDITLVESVQRGVSTTAFDQGRIVCDAGGSGLSEHGVHHFHGLVLDACRTLAGKDATCPSR